MNSTSKNPEATELVLHGRCIYSMQPSNVLLCAEEILSLRPADNLSGTLALELWALEAPYTGGYFEGHALAAATIGCLFGQNVFRDLSLNCVFTEPPAGSWVLCLMLREWNGIAYETKDYVNFDLPYPIATEPDEPEETESSNVIVVNFSAPSTAHEPEAKQDVAPSESEDDAKPVTEPVAKPAPIQTKKSINAVTAKELTGIKGLSQATIGNILAGKPYQHWDDLLKVKGVGQKMQATLRALFAL
jgi:hypothetical protein